MKITTLRDYGLGKGFLMSVYGEEMFKHLFSNGIPDDIEETIKDIVDKSGNSKSMEALRLFWIEGKDIKEISEIQNCSASRVSQKIHEAESYIKCHYSDYLIHGYKSYKDKAIYIDSIIKGEDVDESINEEYDDIDNLGLSIRACCYCKREGIFTITELKRKLINGELSNVRNIGIKSIKEIADKLYYDISSNPAYENLIHIDRMVDNRTFCNEYEKNLYIRAHALTKLIEESMDQRNIDDTDAALCNIQKAFLKKVRKLNEKRENK